jgi:hypothetical protein
MGWVTAAYNWFHNRTEHKEQIRNYMTKMREEFDSQPAMLATVQVLREEQQWKDSVPFSTDMVPEEMRDVPTFLEPVGIRLLMDPKAPDDAYRVFEEEVLLCHYSNILWVRDDYKTKCTYWPNFKRFAMETDERKQRRL